jgi:hypothetical protein
MAAFVIVHSGSEAAGSGGWPFAEIRTHNDAQVADPAGLAELLAAAS